jgi:peptidoglycan/LPS O-acetylase OafA/YrhL
MPASMRASPIMLQDLFRRGRNSFSVLRLMLATSVVLSHSYYLSGYGIDPFERWTGLNLGSLAVDGFFALSGMLVTASLLRDNSVMSFIQHRLARLIPAFWVCLAFCAFVLAPISIVADHGWSSLLNLAEIKSLAGYVIKNAALLVTEPTLPNVLSGLTYRRINPCLWTLAPEASCYILLAFAAALMLLRSKQRSLILVFAFVVGLLPLSNLGASVLRVFGDTALIRLLEIGLHFLAGVLAVLFLGRLRLSLWATAALVILYMCCLFITPLHFLRVPLLAPALAALARVIPLHGRCDETDTSYGIYLYGSALQQFLIWMGWTGAGPWSFFVLSLSITVPLALLSWFAIERPALKKWGRRTTDSGDRERNLSTGAAA